MTDLTYLELFAGVGGMSLGFEMAGFRCVGHAEIEKFPRRVLTHRWPDTPLFGDVCELRGEQVEQPTIVTFGAPCQDLSVAGKRAGLAGSRSSLFYEGIRLWHETQATYALYENVLGALSSNKGRDFASVLSSFVGSPVAVPADGWRGGGGVVCGRGGVAAWRVLDAQFFGVPQRRRRVFVLGTRTGGVDPAEVLALSEGVSGYPATGREAGEGVAADAGTGTPASGLAINISNGEPRLQEVAGTLQSRENAGGIGSGAQMNAVLAFPIQNPELDKAQNGLGIGDGSDPMYSLESRGHGVVAFDTYNQTVAEGVRHTLRTGGSGDSIPAVYDARGNGDAKVVSTLAGDHGNRVTDYTPIVFGKLQYGRYEDSPNVDATLGARDHAAQHTDIVVAPSIAQGAHPGSYNGQDGDKVAAAILAAAGVGRPRRLTPLECERLMGWPDNWTNVPDERGKPASDSARYKACGNGVATPVAAWIAFRLRQAITGEDFGA